MQKGRAIANISRRIGRQPTTTVGELSRVGLSLFVDRGFEQTTIDDIAAAAGISRRTFFRYFASKNDVPWGDFEGLLGRMRRHLAAVPPDTPLAGALRDAVIDFNTLPDDEIARHRQRMTLLLTVPSLVAHSNLRYAAWRQVIADFAAARLGLPPDELRPQVIGWTVLALSLSAYEQWLRDDQSDLGRLISAAFEVLPGTFDTTPRRRR